jgi:hypothetical protein
MRILFALMFALFGVLLIGSAKQVSRDSNAAAPVGYSNLTGRLSPLGSQVAGACCLPAALLCRFL